MSEYTKEPWRIIAEDPALIEGCGRIAAEAKCRFSRAEVEANARRIVACVNACEGIDIELLEKCNGEKPELEIRFERI